MADATNFKEFTITGVKVKFPFKPYPSQMSMMSMVSICETLAFKTSQKNHSYTIFEHIYITDHKMYQKTTKFST